MKIYNTLKRKKEEFNPIEEGKVKIYTCGPTVYNYFHIGNARAFLFFDVVRRYFEYKGFEVTYVSNLTDIDDKLINKAVEEGSTVKKIAERYIDAFFADLDKLGIRKADYHPKATEFISEMIGMIKELEKKDFAYEANGDVYFDVNKLKEYGLLSGKKLEDLRAGARVEANIQKKSPFDFTLWKKAKENEPSWSSPWGKGRPGWHTECVVMSRKLLNGKFDIHCGGSDLVFPHHENEVAQSYALYGENMANYWMHNGFLNIKGEKMSKSLNNFMLARDVVDKYSEDAVRHFFLSKHYRKPIDYYDKILDESENAVSNWYDTLKYNDYLEIKDNEIDLSESLLKIKRDFEGAMDDDLNTAKAIAVLFELNKIAKNEKLESKYRNSSMLLLVKLGKVLGFFNDLEKKLKSDKSEIVGKMLELFIKYRAIAKQEKNYNLADKIRDDLSALGVVLRDTPDGVKWHIE